MRKFAWMVLPALLLAAGCKKQEAAPQQRTVHEIMKDEVDVRAESDVDQCGIDRMVFNEIQSGDRIGKSLYAPGFVQACLQ